MNTKELNDTINAYTHGSLSAIQFLLQMQLAPHAVANLLTASKLPAKALINIDIGDLMSTDDIDIETTYLEAFNEGYVAKCNSTNNDWRISEVEIPRTLPIIVVYIKFVHVGHAINFINWLKSKGEAGKYSAALEWYDAEGFRVVRVPSILLYECEIPYNPPKQVIEFITEQLGSMNEEKKA